MFARLLRILAVLSLFLATAAGGVLAAGAPAAAAIASGVGWGAGFQFVRPDSAAFAVTLPGSVVAGTARWNAGHAAVVIRVAIGRTAPGPGCMTGRVIDEAGDGPDDDVTVIQQTRCGRGITVAAATETPTGRYIVSMCNATACEHVLICTSCNNLALNMLADAHLPTSGRWFYQSPTLARFDMRLGGIAEFGGTITTSGDTRTVDGTVTKLAGPATTCANAQELGANYRVDVCGIPPSSAPFTYTTDGEVKLGVGFTQTEPPADEGVAMYIPVPVA